MAKRLLVPVNDSAASHASLAVVTRFAQLLSAEVTLFHTVDIQGVKHKNIPDFQVDMIRDRALATGQNLLAACSLELSQYGLSPRQVLVEGSPDEMVCAESDKGYDFLVVGAKIHSDLRDLLMGSVSSELIHHCDRPILAVKHGAQIVAPPEPAGPVRAMVALDDSAASAGCVGFLAALDAVDAFELTLAHVVDPAQADSDKAQSQGQTLIQRQTEVLKKAGYRISGSEVTSGSPGEELCRLFTEGGFELLIIGKPNLGEIKERLLDSVCHHLFHHCPGHQMIVP